MKKTIKIGNQWYSFLDGTPKGVTSISWLNMAKAACCSFVRRVELILFFTIVLLLSLFFIDDSRFLLLRKLTLSLHKDLATAEPLEDQCDNAGY